MRISEIPCGIRSAALIIPLFFVPVAILPDALAQSANFKERFGRLDFDASLAQTEKIMGKPKKQESFTVEEYYWKEGLAGANFSFKVFNKRKQVWQSGFFGTADKLRAKYKKVQLGDSYEKVKKIMGSQGDKRATIAVVEQYWNDKDGSTIFAQFSQGILASKSLVGK
jgi:hypothetical protein